MITVDEALDLVLQHCQPLSAMAVELPAALGRVLAEDVTSDIDSPPHDKSIVDGFALATADLAAGIREFDVIEEVVAGTLPRHALARGQATRIMTGAPIPIGADAVVMVERTTLLPAESPSSTATTVEIDDPAVKPGQNIVRQGASLRRGDTVLRAGHLLRPVEIGLLAEVGCARVNLVRRPTVAVLATGDELVPCDQQPSAGQIRNGNGPMLLALVERAGATPIDLGIARDEVDALRSSIAKGLEADLLVLSGGVSAGVLDLVPSVLAEMHVEQVFHKVSIKPGKPLWFGVHRKPTFLTRVFGLPGNPVSSLVCFERFARPAIARLAGYPLPHASTLRLPLAQEFTQRGERVTYAPARIVNGTVELLRSHGSGDLRAVAEATVFAEFPAGDRVFAAGELVAVWQGL